MYRRIVASPGYGGDVLQFKVEGRDVFAIHRAYTRDRGRDRLALLQSSDPAKRRSISDGCVNVTPEVYQALYDCCRRQPLVIQP